MSFQALFEQQKRLIQEELNLRRDLWMYCLHIYDFLLHSPLPYKMGGRRVVLTKLYLFHDFVKSQKHPWTIEIQRMSQ